MFVPSPDGSIIMQGETVLTDRIKKRKLRRTDEILQAARRVMVAKSYTGATMDDIAAEAGISKPTIYQYFRTKDELFVDLAEPLILSLATKLETIRRTLEEGKYRSGNNIVRDVFNLYYGSFEQDPDLFKLFIIFLQVGVMTEMNREAANRIRILGKKCFDEGNMIISLAIRQGFFRKVDIYKTTDFVWASFWGIVQVEQNKWGRDGISVFLKPVLKYAEKLLIAALVIK